MNDDIYISVLVTLLPICASLLIVQTNPYQALVIRGILGAVAALVYALLGAADVALTEALVGTMLSITLYAVAVRSSLSLRLGVLELQASSSDPYVSILAPLRKAIAPYYMRLERVSYPTPQALTAALIAKDVHAVCVASESAERELSYPAFVEEEPRFQIQTRVQSLYQLMQTNSLLAKAEITYLTPTSLHLTDQSQQISAVFQSMELS